MSIRTGEAHWKGALRQGSGTVSTESDQLNSNYGFSSRFESGKGTNPEELLAAAHAACFSMALSNELEKKGYIPDEIHTRDKVRLEKSPDGFHITQIEVLTEATVPRISENLFKETAEHVKATCPVSKALAAVEITLTATLKPT